MESITPHFLRALGTPKNKKGWEDKLNSLHVLRQYIFKESDDPDVAEAKLSHIRMERECEEAIARY